MAYSFALPLFLRDLQEYVNLILNIEVPDIDLQWAAKIIFNRQPEVVKYTYCLYAIKTENDGGTAPLPRYYRGILDLKDTLFSLLRHRQEYWHSKRHVLHFLENIELDFLRTGRPSTHAPTTTSQGTNTDNSFAEPQDIRQRAMPGASPLKTGDNTRLISESPQSYVKHELPTDMKQEQEPAQFTHPKLRRKVARARRADRTIYVIPAKRRRVMSDSQEEQWDV